MEAVLTLGLVSVILGSASGAQNVGLSGGIIRDILFKQRHQQNPVAVQRQHVIPEPGVLDQRVVKSATRMQASGLLTRRRDEHDARLVRLYLTEQAKSVHNAIETERDALAQRATAGLTDAEQRVLKRALTKIVEEFADGAPGPADDAR